MRLSLDAFLYLLTLRVFDYKYSGHQQFRGKEEFAIPEMRTSRLLF